MCRQSFSRNKPPGTIEITEQWAQLGRKMIERNLNIQPTLKVGPGYQFSVFVNKDLLLEPYVTS